MYKSTQSSSNFLDWRIAISEPQIRGHVHRTVHGLGFTEVSIRRKS